MYKTRQLPRLSVCVALRVVVTSAVNEIQAVVFQVIELRTDYKGN